MSTTIEEREAGRRYISVLRSLNPDPILSQRLDDIEKSLGSADSTEVDAPPMTAR